MKTTTKATISKRDSRIEMLRLSACFFVLILHFKPGTFVEGKRALSRVLITCLCTDAVGIFLFITGFFFFSNQSYSARIKSYIRKIFIPTAVYTLFLSLIYPRLIGNAVDYKNVFYELSVTLFTWNPIIHNAQHLWYMYLYGMIVAVFPLLQLIKNRLLDTSFKKALFMISVLALLTVNDLSGNIILRSEMKPVTVFIPGCLFVIAGGLLYEERHRFQGRIWVPFASLSAFAAINAVRSIYMQSILTADSSATHMYGWYTGAGFICATLLSVTVISLKPFTSDIINKLASNTMDIYILHVIVSEIITVAGYRSWIIATFLDGSENFIQFFKFTVLYSLSVFIICSFFISAARYMFSGLKKHIRTYMH